MVQNVFVRLRRELPGLSKAERRIAENVLAEPQLVMDSTITRLAEACQTSPATVARFCRTMGFSGYPEFRLTVASAASRDEAARDLFRIDDADIDADDSALDVVTKLAFQESKAIEETARHLDLHALDAAVEAIRNARRIEAYGAAASGIAALDLEIKLQRLGLPITFRPDPHLALVNVAHCGPGDVVLVITHSGQTREAAELAALGRERGATTVVITNAPSSAAGKSADHILATSTRESRFRTGAMSSRTAQLAIVDFLMVRLLQGSFDVAGDALERTFQAVRPHHLETSRTPASAGVDH